jgi:hypothetical protein
MATLNIKKFPDKLYKLIEKKAKLDRRSLSQEVIILLQNAIQVSEQPSILELRGLGKEAWNNINISQHIDHERNAWE